MIAERWIPDREVCASGAQGARELGWPQKTREIHNHHFDSTVWNRFAFRDDDVIVASYPKSGTTWTQQIVCQMLFGGDPHLRVADLSPWLDLRIPSNEEKLALLSAQRHRRVIKTHLPVDALVFSPSAKYVYVARDGRDVVWSLFNHHVNANQIWYDLLNDTPGRLGPPIERPTRDILRYWRDWLAKDGFPFWPFWECVRGWWGVRTLPNVLLVHYANLKRDLPFELRRIASFLGIELEANRMPRVLEYCSFRWMKQNGEKVVPLAGLFWDGGSEVFVHRGRNGRWIDTLGEFDVAAYEKTALRELGPECAGWLATGEI
jgi:aryl sulfotransferase